MYSQLLASKMTKVLASIVSVVCTIVVVVALCPTKPLRRSELNLRTNWVTAYEIGFKQEPGTGSIKIERKEVLSGTTEVKVPVIETRATVENSGCSK
mgnify:CR=1 FL=1